MTTPPKVSLILPTFNVGKFIERCITSCANQSLSDIEIIIVDDCGSDDSIEKAKAWSQKDKRIKIIHNEKNLGTYHSRKIGFESSSSNIVIFIDPDDELHPDAAELIYLTASDKDDICDIVFYGHEDIPKRSFWAEKARLPELYISGKFIANDILKAKNLNLGTLGKAYSRPTLQSAYSKLNIPTNIRLTFAEDALLFFAAITTAKKSKTIEKSLYKYYKNPGSATTTTTNESIILHASQIDTILDHMKKFTFLFESTDRLAVQGIFRFFERKLMADKHFILRKYCSPAGHQLYIASIINRFILLKNWKDLARLGVHLISLGRLKP